jgi:hypothetical protein
MKAMLWCAIPRTLRGRGKLVAWAIAAGIAMTTLLALTLMAYRDPNFVGSLAALSVFCY